MNYTIMKYRVSKGFEILTVEFERHLYGAYTCIKGLVALDGQTAS